MWPMPLIEHLRHFVTTRVQGWEKLVGEKKPEASRRHR